MEKHGEQLYRVTFNELARVLAGQSIPSVHEMDKVLIEGH